MANVKITQLPSATTPLTGTEVFPLVQGTTTKQVAITGLFTSPVMTNPTLGTVGQADLINATGLPISTGVAGLGTGIATFLGTPSSSNLRAAVTDETGTGSLVFATSPTLVTPNLGTPTFLVATNATGTALGLIAGSAITNANLTGAVTSVGNATSLGSFTSAQLRTALTDETGSGVAVFATSPTLVTPVLGTPQSGDFSTGTFTWPTFNQNTSGTAAGLSATLAIASGGTAATTAASAIENLLPAYAGNGSKGLRLNSGATALEWVADGGGTVTSVAATVPSFLSIAGSPITTSGTLAISLSGTALPTTSGGTNLTSFTSGGVVYASSTSALATGSALQFNGTNQFTVLAATGTTYNRTESTQYSTFAQHFATSGGTGVEYKTLYRFVDTDAGEIMRLTSTSLYTASGINVGIGTSSPTGYLANKLVIDTSTDYNNGITIASASNRNGSIWFADGKTGNQSYRGGIDYQHTTDTLYLYSGAQGNFQLDSAGNLGLGVTPSAWSGLKAFQINSQTSLSADGTSTQLSTNAYYGSGGWTYIATGYASNYYQTSGTHVWRTAASGTAGTAISFTQAMTLDASGNLLVGATSGSYHTFNKSSSVALMEMNNSNASPVGLYITFNGASPNGTANEFLTCRDTTTNRAIIRSNGGIANYSANDVNLSDRREKTNFDPAGSYLDKICAIPVQTFNYIDQNLEEDAGLTLGVVAQDVQAVAPELVMESNWASKDEEPKMRLSIYQTDLQYALMKCIQEQQAIISAQATVLESLKARLDAANL